MPALRGDGNLYITFMSMGQGDCTMVSLPNGKTMMIDCGTSRWDTDFNTGLNRDQTADEQTTQARKLRQGVIDIIYEPRFLSGYDTLDALILTHPDKDHCNELDAILKPATTINALYHSTTIGKYIQGGADYFVHNKANLIAEYAITINQTKKEITNGQGVNAAIIDADNVTTINRKSTTPATKGFVKILEGTKGIGKACDVYILASNVEKYQNVNDRDTKPVNRASVVTLIIYGSQKFLICGDATANTEKFILAEYNTDIDRIADLELVQVGHHASLTSSSHSTDKDAIVSAIRFVDKVNPRLAIISAATDSGSRYKLPRFETIAKYTGCARMNALNHIITCWWEIPAVYQIVGTKRRLVTPVGVEKGQQAIDKHIVSTGDLGAIDVERSDADV